MRIIVVDVHEGNQMAPRSAIADIPRPWQAFFDIVHGDLARAIPSLRFISTLYVPKVQHDATAYLNQDYDGEQFAWWRTAARASDSANARLDKMPSEAGERIHRHLLSNAFEQTLTLDGVP